MYWVYILKRSDGSYYVGRTENLQTRVAQHNAGEGGDYTSRRRPVALVFSAEFQTENEAFQCERQLKGWSRRKKEALIRGDMRALIDASHSETQPDTRRTSQRPSTGSGR